MIKQVKTYLSKLRRENHPKSRSYRLIAADNGENKQKGTNNEQKSG